MEPHLIKRSIQNNMKKMLKHLHKVFIKTIEITYN